MSKGNNVHRIIVQKQRKQLYPYKTNADKVKEMKKAGWR